MSTLKHKITSAESLFDDLINETNNQNSSTTAATSPSTAATSPTTAAAGNTSSTRNIELSPTMSSYQMNETDSSDDQNEDVQERNNVPEPIPDPIPDPIPEPKPDYKLINELLLKKCKKCRVLLPKTAQKKLLLSSRPAFKKKKKPMVKVVRLSAFGKENYGTLPSVQSNLNASLRNDIATSSTSDNGLGKRRRQSEPSSTATSSSGSSGSSDPKKKKSIYVDTDTDSDSDDEAMPAPQTPVQANGGQSSRSMRSIRKETPTRNGSSTRNGGAVPYQNGSLTNGKHSSRNKALETEFGKQFFNCHVRVVIIRNLKNLSIKNLEKKLKLKAKKPHSFLNANKSVSFVETVEVFGGSDSDVGPENDTSDRISTTDSMNKDSLPSDDASEEIPEDKQNALSSTPNDKPGKIGQIKKSFSPLKGENEISTRSELLKMGDEKIVRSNRIIDEDDDEEENENNESQRKDDNNDDDEDSNGNADQKDGEDDDGNGEGDRDGENDGDCEDSLSHEIDGIGHSKMSKLKDTELHSDNSNSIDSIDHPKTIENLSQDGFKPSKLIEYESFSSDNSRDFTDTKTKDDMGDTDDDEAATVFDSGDSKTINEETETIFDSVNSTTIDIDSLKKNNLETGSEVMSGPSQSSVHLTEELKLSEDEHDITEKSNEATALQSQPNIPKSATKFSFNTFLKSIKTKIMPETSTKEQISDENVSESDTKLQSIEDEAMNELIGTDSNDMTTDPVKKVVSDGTDLSEDPDSGEGESQY